MIKEVEEKVLDISEVTLLSTNEAELAKENVPDILASTCGIWWLRSPDGYYDRYATFIVDNGSIYFNGDLPSDNFGVRPALRISNLKSNGLQIGDKIEVANHTWTVISDNMALCDDIVARCPFNEYYKNGNDYTSSDIKQFVDAWTRNHNLEFKAEERDDVAVNQDIKH